MAPPLSANELRTAHGSPGQAQGRPRAGLGHCKPTASPLQAHSGQPTPPKVTRPLSQLLPAPQPPSPAWIHGWIILMATNTSIGRPPALSLPRLPTSFPPCTTTTIVAYFTVCLIVAQPQTASHRLSTVAQYHCWTSPIESYTLYILPTAFRAATAFATLCAPTVASPPALANRPQSEESLWRLGPSRPSPLQTSTRLDTPKEPSDPGCP